MYPSDIIGGSPREMEKARNWAYKPPERNNWEQDNLIRDSGQQIDKIKLFYSNHGKSHRIGRIWPRATFLRKCVLNSTTAKSIKNMKYLLASLC